MAFEARRCFEGWNAELELGGPDLMDCFFPKNRNDRNNLVLPTRLVVHREEGRCLSNNHVVIFCSHNTQSSVPRDDMGKVIVLSSLPAGERKASMLIKLSPQLCTNTHSFQLS